VTARRLRETLDHYLAGSPSGGKQEGLDRIVREQAFTVLNRLCALQMAEARGLLIESIARGYNSKGFQLYARLAGSALDETGDAYRGYHRLTDQTLYTCVNDFVEPKLKQVASEIQRFQTTEGKGRKAEKEYEELTQLELELKDFRDELLRLAKFWKPNLNDGVQITAAPLWKLFQYRPWQKKLKETWESLEAGEYDWAHLAYSSIWPDRVREKCRTDKSLAIAHGLEELYQEPEKPGKKKRGKKKAGA